MLVKPFIWLCFQKQIYTVKLHSLSVCSLHFSPGNLSIILCSYSKTHLRGVIAKYHKKYEGVQRKLRRPREIKKNAGSPSNRLQDQSENMTFIQYHLQLNTALKSPKPPFLKIDDHSTQSITSSRIPTDCFRDTIAFGLLLEISQSQGIITYT